MKPYKSCFNCKHTINHRSAGSLGSYWEPPEAAECNCQCKEVNFDDFEEYLDIEDSESWIAENCSHYESEIVKCDCCSKEIKACDALMVAYWEAVPVCSVECKKQMEEQIEKEIEESERLEEEWKMEMRRK